MGFRSKFRPHVISRESAAEILMSKKDDICGPFFHGWNAFWRWKDVDPEFYSTVVPRTRAGVVYDFAIKDARTRFEGRESEGVRTRAEFDSLLVIFDEELVLRFKKLDDGERPRNSRTSRQWLFERQCLQLPGIPEEATKVTAVYTLNPDQSSIVKVSVVCWCVNTLKWIIPLFEADSGNMVFEFPAPASYDSDRPKTIVRPKIPGQKEGGGI